MPGSCAPYAFELWRGSSGSALVAGVEAIHQSAPVVKRVYQGGRAPFRLKISLINCLRHKKRRNLACCGVRMVLSKTNRKVFVIQSSSMRPKLSERGNAEPPNHRTAELGQVQAQLSGLRTHRPGLELDCGGGVAWGYTSIN